MRIIVTGAVGFIGSHLVDKLVLDGYDVITIDTKHGFGVGKHHHILDLTNQLHTLMKLENCDCIVHLAGYVGVERTEKDPLGTLDSNIISTKNVLEACRLNDIGRLVFSSSSEVYGDLPGDVMNESQISRPISVYGVSKLACEEYIKTYGKVYGLKFCILRYFNAYGPRQVDSFIVSRFMKLALKNEPMIVHGDGSQIRCFTYVSDIVNGTMLAIFVDGSVGQTINIGDDRQPTSIATLAKKIKEITSSKSEIRFIPLEKTVYANREIQSRIPDITKAKKVLGYEPYVTLDNGLKRLASWMRENPK